MAARKRSIQDYFSPVGNKRRKYEVRSNKSDKKGSTNEKTTAKHDEPQEILAMEPPAEIPSSKKIKTLDMPVLSDNEENLFPVSLSEFRKYTNVNDLIIEDIKRAKAHSWEQYLSNKQYVTETTRKFYAIFYTKPKYRQSYPFNCLKTLNGCPKNMEERIFDIPERYQKKKRHKHKKKEKNKCPSKTLSTDMTREKTENQGGVLLSPKSATTKSQLISIEKATTPISPNQLSPQKVSQENCKTYPVSLNEFKKFVNFDEDFEHFLSMLCKKDPLKIAIYREMKNVRSNYDTKFYKRFYENPSDRHKLKWKFRPCPKSKKEKILSNIIETAQPSEKEKSKPKHESNNNDTNLGTKTNNNNEENNFVTISNLPDLSNEENKLIPVQFNEFLESTNVLDVIDREISQNMQSNLPYIKKMAQKFFKAFYFKPELRSSKPLSALTFQDDSKNKFLQLPSINHQHEVPIETKESLENTRVEEAESEISDQTEINPDIVMVEEIKAQKQINNVLSNGSPSKNDELFKLFTKYVNCDEIVDEIFKEASKNDPEKYEILQRHTDLHAKAVHNYFRAFYKKADIRERYQFVMKPCPSNIRNIILQLPGKESQNDENSQEGRKITNTCSFNANEMQNTEEMLQLKKQQTLKNDENGSSSTKNSTEMEKISKSPSIDSQEKNKQLLNSSNAAVEEMPTSTKQLLKKHCSPKANVSQSVEKMQKTKQYASVPNKNSKIVNLIDFVENLSDDFFKKYFALKSINCGTDEMRLIQHIKNKLAKNETFARTQRKINAVHILSVEVYKPPNENIEVINKKSTLVYFAAISQGLKQRILSAILVMSFDEFREYARLHNICDSTANKLNLKLYNCAIAVEKLWHTNLYISLLDLQKYLASKDILIKNADFEHIPPMILSWKEIVLVTNFDDIVGLDYFKESGKTALLQDKMRQQFYDKCKSNNQWILKSPALIENWKEILQQNNFSSSKNIVPPRKSLSTDNSKKVKGTNADDALLVHHNHKIKKDLDFLTLSQANPYEIDDIETVIHPFHLNNNCLDNRIFGRNFKNEENFIISEISDTTDKETVIFPLNRRSKELTTSFVSKLDNSEETAISYENQRSATKVFRCEATLLTENEQNLGNAIESSELLSGSAESNSKCSGSHVLQSGVVSVEKLSDKNETNECNGEKLSQDIFLPSCSASQTLPSSSEVHTKKGIKISQDVLFSSASTDINCSPTDLELFYAHLVKTPSKFTSTQEGCKNQTSNKKLQFLQTKSDAIKTPIPLSPNLFISSSGSTNSQNHNSENLVLPNTITDCRNELNSNDNSSLALNDNVEFFVNMPNTQTQIQSLPPDESLGCDPLSDDVEVQMSALFAESASTTVLNQELLSKDRDIQNMFNTLLAESDEGGSQDVILKENKELSFREPTLEQAANSKQTHNLESLPSLEQDPSLEQAPTFDRAINFEVRPNLEQASDFEQAKNLQEVPNLNLVVPCLDQVPNLEQAPILEPALNLEQAPNLELVPTSERAPMLERSQIVDKSLNLGEVRTKQTPNLEQSITSNQAPISEQVPNLEQAHTLQETANLEQTPEDVNNAEVNECLADKVITESVLTSGIKNVNLLQNHAETETELNEEEITSHLSSEELNEVVNPDAPETVEKKAQPFSGNDLNVKDTKDIKTELPNRLQFTLDDTQNVIIVETMEQSVITISDDEGDADGKNNKKNQKIEDDDLQPIKQEVKFLNNLQFTIDDSVSKPVICPVNPTPPIVLDDDGDDCNEASSAETLINKLMNPTEESTIGCTGMSRVPSDNNNTAGTFCEAQKLPSSFEDNQTIAENTQSTNESLAQIALACDEDEHSVQNEGNTNKSLAFSENTDSNSTSNGNDSENVELFVDSSNSLQCSEELILEINIQTTEGDLDIPIDEASANVNITVEEEQQKNSESSLPTKTVEATKDDHDNGAAETLKPSIANSVKQLNNELANANVISNLLNSKNITKRKPIKSTTVPDVVPQILHSFRPLHIAVISKANEEEYAQLIPSDVNPEAKTHQESPSEISATQNNIGSSSRVGAAIKSFSASQALATDCTLFNNTELLRDLEQLQSNPQKPKSVNIQSMSSTCSLTSTVSTASSAIEQVNNIEMKSKFFKTIFYRRIQKFHYFQTLTENHVAQYNLPDLLAIGQQYMQAQISSGHSFNLYGDFLKGIFPNLSRGNLEDIQSLLADLKEFHYSAFQNTPPEDFRKRTLFYLFHLSPGICFCNIKFDCHAHENGKVFPPPKDYMTRQPHRPLIEAIKPTILEKLSAYKLALLRNNR